MSDREIALLLDSLDASDVERIVASGIDVSASEEFTQTVKAAVLSRAAEKGANTMKLKKNKKRFVVILVAAILVTLTAVGVAASGILRLPIDYTKVKEKTGLTLSDKMIRILPPDYSNDSGAVVVNNTIETDGYAVTLECLLEADEFRDGTFYRNEFRDGAFYVTGDTISRDVTGTYAVVTVSRLDGGPIGWHGNPNDPNSLSHAEINASALIHTAWPNGATQYLKAERETGMSKAYEEDGVLYLFVDVTDLLCYADKGVSVAVYGDLIYDVTMIGLDEKGVPYFTDQAPALHAMFELPLDPSLADVAAQKAFEHEHMVSYGTNDPHVVRDQ